MNIGVVIGRFQVDNLHNGHKALIQEVLVKHPVTVVLVGVTKRNAENPLDFVMRQQMIHTHFPQTICLPLADTPGDDKAWSYGVDRTLDLTFPDATFTLYGGRSSFIPAYSGDYATYEINYGDHDWSGTRCRERITRDGPVNDPRFRAGVIYAVGHEPDSPHRLV